MVQHDLVLEESYFQYVGFGRVRDFRGAGGRYRYPPPTMSMFYHLYSKVVHELAHTAGRKMRFLGRLAVAAVLRKKPQDPRAAEPQPTNDEEIEPQITTDEHG